MTICKKCKKRESCTELCAKAEKYVSQDTVSYGSGGRETYLPHVSERGSPDLDPLLEFINFNVSEKKGLNEEFKMLQSFFK